MNVFRLTFLAFALLLPACAIGPLLPEDRAELDARRPPDVVLGEPMRLFDEPPLRVAGLAARDGRVHIFQIDAARALRHAEVDANGVVAREQLATLDQDPKQTPLDAIEWPPGTLRVVAGSSQFVRATASPVWQEWKDNRCRRFLVVGDRLFCAFVMSGEEFGAPKRSDVYFGIILIVPFAIPVERQSQKLVIAEAVANIWVVRAVVDAEDPLDARGLQQIGTDASGDAHLLYTVGRGGAFIFSTGPAIGAVPPVKLRYTRISGEALRSSPGATEQVGHASVIAVKGREVQPPPCFAWDWWSQNSWNFSRWEGRLENRFAVGSDSGTIEGLAATLQSPVRIGGRTLTFFGELDVTLRDGKWDERVAVVLRNDWPDAGMEYRFSPPVDPKVRFDSSGALHALMPHCTNHPIWDACIPALSYLVKRDGTWSRPVTFGIGRYSGKLAYEHAKAYTLLIASSERAYIGWVEEDGGFAGRWILRGSGVR